MTTKRILRPFLAIVAGYAAWVAAFWIPMILMSLIWPDLREVAQVFWQEQRYDIFDTSMLVSFQFVWVLANGAAGFVARCVSKRPLEVWCGAIVLFAYFAYNHWWALWGIMPDWYNVIVVIPVVPALLVGSWAAGHMLEKPHALATEGPP